MKKRVRIYKAGGEQGMVTNPLSKWMMQMGGVPQAQPSDEQLFTFVMNGLSEEVAPEDLYQQLVSQNIDPNKADQIVSVAVERLEEEQNLNESIQTEDPNSTEMLEAEKTRQWNGLGTDEFIKRVSDSPVLLYFTRFVFILGTIVVMFFYFTSEQALGDLSPDKYLEEVAVIQQDFAQNKTYVGPRYNLGITDYSTAGMIKAAPLAMITAYFRPFLWEASSAFMLLSALEGTVLMVLLFRFIFLSGSITKQIQFVRKNEILVFAFVFVLVFGFFVGFSAGLFNVLIRFKAPLLPFLLLLLASSNKWERNNTPEENEEMEELPLPTALKRTLQN
jgi:hypothetical protein